MKDRFNFRAKDKETGEWRYGYYAELPCGLGSSGVNSEYADTDSFILTCTKKQSTLYSNAEPHEVFHCEQFRVDGETLSQCTGLKDKNGLNWLFEYDIIDGEGIKIGNYYENKDLLKTTTNYLIKRMGTKEWRNSEQEAIKRGCFYAE